MTIRIAHISDTHDREFNINEKVDVLVHTGDYSFLPKNSSISDQVDELERFNSYLEANKKFFDIALFVPGNHDFIFETNELLASNILTNAVTLIDESYTYKDYLFYGTPSQPEFFNWAFNHDEKTRTKKYSDIPENVDILMTHSPAYRILDRTRSGENVGCSILNSYIYKLKPRAHCFGHIHESYGQKRIDKTFFSNASINNLNYNPVNSPNIFEIS